MRHPQSWLEPPLSPVLGPDDVHVWRADLDACATVWAALAATLAPDEADRAVRYHFDRDRHRFIVRRGLLRKLIADYLGCAPSGIRFTYSAYGKPAAADASPLRFNVSHSHGMAIYALTLGRGIGVDIERVDATRAERSLARRFFAPGEVTALSEEADRLGPDAWVEGFFRCWTRKEGYIKARGEGLSVPLDAFEVTVRRGEPPALRWSRDDDIDRWCFSDLPPVTAFATSLVVQEPAGLVTCFALPDPPGPSSDAPTRSDGQGPVPTL